MKTQRRKKYLRRRCSGGRWKTRNETHKKEASKGEGTLPW